MKDIPRTAKLAITVYDILGPGKAEPVGGTTVSLFGKRRSVQQRSVITLRLVHISLHRPIFQLSTGSSVG